MHTLARYSLGPIVYSGDSVTMYQATRDVDGTRALLKLPSGDAHEPQVAEQLQHEFTVGSSLSHPGVLRYRELLEEADHIAIVHEWFEAESLNARVLAGGIDLSRFLTIAQQLAEGLAAIHAQGFLHRAITPAGILVDRSTNVAKYADLRFAEPAASAQTRRRRSVSPYTAPEETGRTNHRVDARSDLYALGATLYHLLTGAPPFTARDPLELVHQHLARLPEFPPAVRAEHAEIVLTIVSKLLAKAPDDRYQSAAGLKADLGLCAAWLASGVPLLPFPLGQHDPNRMFRLPDRLYGRDAEVAALREAMTRAASGRTELLLVAGPSGSGKSALVEQLRSSVGERGALFAAGKFEQLSTGVPYSAIRQAFQVLVANLLQEPPAVVSSWRERLLGALGTQAQVIIDVIPEVEHVVGPQPPVTVLSPAETQNRFTRLFQQFVRVFGTSPHALVLFLDDWQWADHASLHLIESVCTAPDAQALLLVGAYRDNELGPRHPAASLIARLQESGAAVTRVSLPPLTVADIAHLVEDGLRLEPGGGDALARQIHQRTGGNPFFIRASLRDLYDRRLLTLSADGRWGWAPEGLMQVAPAPDVVALLVARIRRLAPDVREVLEVAACLGSACSTATLAIASGLDQQALAPLVDAALEAHVLVRDEQRLRFLHDRVQEAAYSLIAAGQVAELHLQIGRRLLARADESIEAVAGALPHLNAGRYLLESASERRHLAALNQQEGRRARRSTAYAAAAEHAGIGIELLGDTAWDDDYALTLDLYELKAEAEYLAGRFDTAERLYPDAIAAARTDLDRIRILNVQKDQYELQGRYLDAIAVLRRGLALVGVTFADDEHAMAAAIADELRQLPAHLRGRSIEDLVDAPALEDPLQVATLRMLMGMWPSCYVAGLQSLLALVSVKIANFSLQHGNCEITPAAYVNYSFVAGFITGDYEQAYRFGKVGMALARRYDNRSVESWCCFLLGCGTLIWRAPLNECRPYLEQAVRQGVESGNISSASYAASYIITDAFLSGAPLDRVRALYEEYVPFLQRSNPAIHLFCELGTQSFRALAGMHTLDDDAFLRMHGSSPFFKAVYRFGRLLASYLTERVERAAVVADDALSDTPRLLAGTFKAPDTWFYAGLVAARSADAAGEPQSRERWRRRIDDLHAQLRPLAQQCPVNFAHKTRLIEAEQARLDGDRGNAAFAYEEAAMLAARHGFTHDEGIAYERAARFWLTEGLHTRAAAAAMDAVRTFRRWGAARKAEELRAEFAELLGRDWGGISPEAPLLAWPSDRERLDLLSVTKASQAISREIDRDRLLTTLMHIVTENVGATRAVLLLRESGEMMVVAATHVDRPWAAEDAIVPHDDVPTSIVQYVADGGHPLILDDASRDSRFGGDDYVAAHRLRSVMCWPLRQKDRLTGVLYLENELSTGVFTADRATVLELLLGQVAISLENSQLYARLRSSIERAEEARDEAERANRAKDEFLAMLGHELRNPLAPILTACELMRLKAPEQFRREREIIDRQLRHVTRLVDDLLDVSRIARGKIDLQTEPVTVSDVIAKAVEVVEPLLEERRIRLVTSVPSDLQVLGDAVRLRQVFSNLLNNAAKFSPSDSTVHLAAERRGTDVCVCVRDEGVGIAPDLLPEIFDMFVQGAQSTERSRGGLGLGLTIARSLVRMHRGTITASSAGAGLGTQFEVRLPLLTAAGREESIPLPRERAVGLRRRILVVDDNQDAADTLAEALRVVGHRVTIAHDAATALAILDGGDEFDAAILDIGLPVLDGYELARRIRALPQGRTMMLVALTGYGLAKDRSLALEAGFDAHLTKPVDLPSLESFLSGTPAGELHGEGST